MRMARTDRLCSAIRHIRIHSSAGVGFHSTIPCAPLISYNKMHMKLPQPLRFVMDALFPPRCAACPLLLPEAGPFLCEACRASIPVSDSPQCPVCGARLPRAQLLCHRDAGYVLFAASTYGNAAVRALIHALKYGAFERAARPLASLLLSHVERETSFFEHLEEGKWIAVPLPLHSRKEHKRGFNQSEALLREFSRLVRAFGHTFPKTEKRALLRIRSTESQTKQRDYRARRENVAGAFAVPRPGLVSGKNILLVDDVFTSGATMEEAVRTLKKNGARKIFALVAAKA